MLRLNMSNPALRNLLFLSGLIIALTFIFFPVFSRDYQFVYSYDQAAFYQSQNSASQETGLFGEKELLEQKGLTVLMRQAREYRLKGLDQQRKGDLTGAMSWYQKATELDPEYVVAFNDLGVIYEMQGFIDRAKECYSRAITLDPYYASPYTNLAYLYEGLRDLDKAVYYWRKRAALGSPDDPWTLQAKRRLQELAFMLGATQELEVFDPYDDITFSRSLLRRSGCADESCANAALAWDYFQRALRLYERGEYVSALKEAINAQQLDPTNEQISGFVDMLQTRLLTR